MPKILENVKNRIIDEARKQINENGYDNVTIRSIARGCYIGTGTFYNYFKSKDMLIATFLLEDWNERINRLCASSEGESDPMVTIRNIYDELSEFISNNASIFSSIEAIKSFNSSVGGYHKVLRGQIAAPIYNSCVKGEYQNAKFLSEFSAEAILTWTVAKKDYDEIASVMKKMFIK